MKKYTKLFALVSVMILAVLSLAACGLSNNPKKTQEALEKRNYTVETIIGDSDIDSQAELDSMSDEMSLSAGELVAMLAAYKEKEEDEVSDFIYIYYFKDGKVANKFWDENQQQLSELKTEYKDAEGFEINKSGSVVYFGTKQAIEDCM